MSEQRFTELCAQVLDETIRMLGGAARTQQSEMTVAIADAIEQGNNLLVQAGTGVGKSFGYLVPLMVRCALGGGHQLVATSSLALQRQILSKDAQVVADATKKCLGVEPTYAPLKGWANYICRYQLSGGFGSQEGLWEERDSAQISAQQLEALRQWAKTTETGDRDDVPFSVGAPAWRQASVTKRECLGRKCALIEQCFPAIAKTKAFEADIVVTNHALLGIYVNGRQDVLPAFDTVVVDEAHDLVSRVRSQGTVSLSPGVVRRVARAVKPVASDEAQAIGDVSDLLDTALEHSEAGLVTLRSDELLQAMRDIDQASRDARQAIRAKADGQEETAVHVARASLDELDSVMDAWSANPETMITWISESINGRYSINLAPLGVESLLAKNLFSEGTAVLTSATLTMGGSFDQALIQTGMNFAANECSCLDVGTSFEPASQGILYIAGHLDEPGRNGLGADTLQEVVDLIEASGGGALGLFSSRAAAESAAEYVRSETDLEVLLQGEDSLSSLVSQFRDNEDSCLFGTISLWQGVDVPGRSCRLVIIDRIPFPRPSDPVTQARSRFVAKSNRNAFLEVSLAPAALLMAQGAGRLLRSAADKGVVAVLDSRIQNRQYGGYIRQTMPAMWPTKERGVVMSALRRISNNE